MRQSTNAKKLLLPSPLLSTVVCTLNFLHSLVSILFVPKCLLGQKHTAQVGYKKNQQKIGKVTRTKFDEGGIFYSSIVQSKNHHCQIPNYYLIGLNGTCAGKWQLLRTKARSRIQVRGRHKGPLDRPSHQEHWIDPTSLFWPWLLSLGLINHKRGS